MLMFLTPEKSNTSLNMALVKSTFLEKLGVGSTLLEVSVMILFVLRLMVFNQQILPS
jgi:hypothetical protein